MSSEQHNDTNVLELDGGVQVIVDHSNESVDMDGIQQLQRSFLDSVTENRTECESLMVNVCTMEPNGPYALLIWDKEFLECIHVKRMIEKNMFPNNLETLIAYKDGVPTLPSIVFAVLESIRVVVNPVAVHMMNGSTTNQCRIVFCTR